MKAGASDVEKASDHKADGSAAQCAVRGTPNGKAPESAKVASGEKKGDRGPTANGATASSTDSSATNGDTGAKHDKKDDTAKKDATGKKDATK